MDAGVHAELRLQTPPEERAVWCWWSQELHSGGLAVAAVGGQAHCQLGCRCTQAMGRHRLRGLTGRMGRDRQDNCGLRREPFGSFLMGQAES